MHKFRQKKRNKPIMNAFVLSDVDTTHNGNDSNSISDTP